MDTTEVFQRLGLALGLGLLVGLQRQKAASALAGIRTFPIITMLGAVSTLLALKFGGWLIAAGFLSLAALLVVGNLHKITSETSDRSDAGLTTEVAVLAMFGIGAYAMFGYLPVTLALGAGVAVLLHLKRPLHAFIKKIGDRDLMAIMQFALIALVILPVLPNQTYGPYDVFNPFETWLVVVLIVGISLAAYLVYRLFGARVGTVIGGILGGLISSTATTVSYAQKAKQDQKVARFAATVIAIASTVAFARIIGEIFVMTPKFSLQMCVPLAITFAIMVVGSLALLVGASKQQVDLKNHGNPAELKSALTFGLLYAAIGLAVAMAKDVVGDNGLYVVGAISGLTDVDALTISTAQMTQTGRLDPHVAWQVIMIGALANLLFKGCVIAVIGRAQLAKYVLPVFLSATIAGGALIFMWPNHDNKPNTRTAQIDNASAL